MRNFALTLAVICTTCAALLAQITEEHTFAERFSYVKLYRFSATQEKYVLHDSDTSGYNVIKLYELNHALYKTLTVPNPYGQYSSGSLFIISDHLFDTDDGLEYMMAYRIQDNIDNFKVYEEDGSLVYEFDTVEIENEYGEDNFINTPAGTKLVVHNYKEAQYGTTTIYSLPGTYMSRVDEDANESPIGLSHPAPNPSANSAVIRYELPLDVQDGEIVIYNIHGVEQKRYRVDRTFNTLLLDNTQLPPGQYLYHLVTTHNQSDTKKMVVIR